MRRAHRTAHLLIWALVAPLAIAGLAIALLTRPPGPAGDLPASIAAEAP